MRLAILLTAGLETEDGHTVRQLSQAAVALGHEVDIFLMDDGVYQLPRLLPLAQRGVRITMCSHNVHERGLVKLEGALYGGQPDWAEIVRDADRVISFG